MCNVRWGICFLGGEREPNASKLDQANRRALFDGKLTSWQAGKLAKLVWDFIL